MAVKIIRNTGWDGSLFKIQIKVNGEKIAGIHDGQKLDIELPHEKASLKVSQTGVKSNEVIVEDGDFVEITSTMTHQLIFPLTIVLIFMYELSSFEYSLLINIVFILIALLISFLINGFHLKVLKD